MQYAGNLVVAPDRERAIYTGLRRKAPNNIITPGFIRLEQQLSSGQGQYQFQIGKNVGNPSATEVRLDLNDAFVATKLGIYLLNDDPSLPGHSPLLTFPSPVDFPAEAGNVNPSHLEAFYNGFLRVKVADVVYAEAMATRKFRVVRDQQSAPAVAVGTNWPAAPQKLSETLGFDGLEDLTPQFIFQGQAKNELSLYVPANSTQQVQYVTATTRIKVVWYMEGFLITQGSALGSALQG
ncbi:MAG: hypothetical protein EPN37_15615 [Chitinophagaceae bacterium]|nr:MAG: hypothetical protein EPN37_15615 [Chitinophagaceae bacterium]